MEIGEQFIRQFIKSQFRSTSVRDGKLRCLIHPFTESRTMESLACMESHLTKSIDQIDRRIAAYSKSRKCEAVS